MIDLSPNDRTGAEAEQSLPRLMALDLAFSALAEAGNQDVPLLIGGATAGTIGDLLARSTGPIAFLDEGNLPAPDVPRPESEETRFHRSLWIAPDPATWQRTAARIDRHLSPGAQLVVVGNGPLASLLAQLRPGALGIPESPVRPRQIGLLLGYRSAREWHLYGISSVLWAILRMISDRLRRSDLADRCQAAFQQSVAEPGLSRLWGITVLATEKPARLRAADSSGEPWIASRHVDREEDRYESSLPSTTTTGRSRSRSTWMKLLLQSRNTRSVLIFRLACRPNSFPERGGTRLWFAPP